MTEPHVVVVEDDEGIGGSLTRTLAGQGYAVDWARTGGEAFELVRDGTALVVLDLGLPDADGLDVCRRLRRRASAPQILVLTARGEEADVVLGLDAGADDYLVKPFRLAELLARVRARARASDGRQDVLTLGELTVDIGARTVRCAEEAIELRPKEFDLLVALARSAGRVVTRERLMEDVWDEHWFGSTKTLDIHIWALRRKLAVAGAGAGAAGTAPLITTVRGVGYRMETA
jgi:DNA-binding response OmpR family regulator